jgi:hypothetical protein
MATVNFSVPDDVKARFNRAFAGQNKSQIIADLMMRAVEEQALKKRRARARSLGHHLFDALYHAVALEVEGALLVTADEHYHREACAHGSIVLLSGFSPLGARQASR